MDHLLESVLLNHLLHPDIIPLTIDQNLSAFHESKSSNTLTDTNTPSDAPFLLFHQENPLNLRNHLFGPMITSPTFSNEKKEKPVKCMRISFF